MHSLVLLAVLLVGACGAETVTGPPSTTPPSQQRLVPLPDEFWWWQSPTTPDGAFASREVSAVWGPISYFPAAAPTTLKPLFDTKLQTKCLPYLMAIDGTERCLPGWVQTDQPLKTQNGFFVNSAELRKCFHYVDWRFAIPATNYPQYLILFDVGNRNGVRVYEAIPETEGMFFGWYTAPAKYPACEVPRSDWHYYRKGKEVPAELFPMLPSSPPPN